MRLCAVSLSVLLLGACAPKPPQRAPDLEVAHRRLDQNPGDPRSYYDLARLYFRYGDYLRARQYLSIAERAPGKLTDSVFRLGIVIRVRNGQFDEAIQRCKAQLEVQEDPDIRLLLANLLESVGDLGGAELQRKLVIAARPDDLHQLIELARFYLRLGRPEARERAVELYRRYLQAAPAGADAPLARAALLMQDLSPGVLERTN